MAQDELMQLIEFVTVALDQEGVTYAITGSIASSIHGELSASLDVDIVASLTPEQGIRVAKRVVPRLYVDVDVLRQAAIRHTMANLIDANSGYKVDLSVLADTPYHAAIMERRCRVSHPGSNRSFWVVSPEDVILMKLVWRKDSRSEKQWRNALGVARVRGHQLDWAYLRRWAATLGVEKDLDQLMQEADV